MPRPPFYDGVQILRTDVWLKFDGKELDVRSIPIYELGDTLVAVQRIVHKMFLYNRRLTRGAHLRRDERQRLSLQISERRKSSDLYALVPFVVDPVVQHYISTLVKSGLTALEKLLLRVSHRRKGKAAGVSLENENVEGALQIAAIYAETVQITNHINNIGGVETIQLLPLAICECRPLSSHLIRRSMSAGLPAKQYRPSERGCRYSYPLVSQ